MTGNGSFITSFSSHSISTRHSAGGRDREERKQPRLRGDGGAAWRRVKEEPLFLDRPLLGLHVQCRRGVGKRIGHEGRHGAESKGGEIEEAWGEDVGLSRGKPGTRLDGEAGYDGVEAELLEGIPPLVEPETWLGFLGGDGLEGRNRVVGGVGLAVGQRSGVGGSGELLDDLLEGGGVGLDEGGRVRAVWLGSDDGSGRERRRRRLLDGAGSGGGTGDGGRWGKEIQWWVRFFLVLWGALHRWFRVCDSVQNLWDWKRETE